MLLITAGVKALKDEGYMDDVATLLVGGTSRGYNAPSSSTGEVNVVLKSIV